MKEAVYDNEISPLMKQIIAICKREKIGLLACFSIGGDEKPGYQCTTALLTDEFDPTPSMREANDVLQRKPEYMTVVISDRPHSTQ